MQNISNEYLLLFNVLSSAEETLNQLRYDLIAAQQRAEELYITCGEDAREEGRAG